MLGAFQMLDIQLFQQKFFNLILFLTKLRVKNAEQIRSINSNFI
jgi:hypothetical protein